MALSGAAPAPEPAKNPPAPAQPQEAPKIDPKAERILKGMCDYLAAQKTFSVEAGHVLQAVLKSGEKLDFVADSDLTVQRPNKLRSDRLGEIAHVSFYYDGKDMTIFGRKVNMYATTPAPPTLDEAIDFARQKLDIDAPAADLLYAKPYDTLMEDVVSSQYVSEATIDGQKCHHLAFRGNETDWQIWVADGPQPLPLRYTIVTKKVAGEPQFTVTLAKWNTNPHIVADTFTFTPPKGAERIDFLRNPAPKHTERERSTP
jgi:hypothetical protein